MACGRDCRASAVHACRTVAPAGERGRPRGRAFVGRGPAAGGGGALAIDGASHRAQAAAWGCILRCAVARRRTRVLGRSMRSAALVHFLSALALPSAVMATSNLKCVQSERAEAGSSCRTNHDSLRDTRALAGMSRTTGSKGLRLAFPAQMLSCTARMRIWGLRCLDTCRSWRQPTAR